MGKPHRLSPGLNGVRALDFATSGAAAANRGWGLVINPISDYQDVGLDVVAENLRIYG